MRVISGTAKRTSLKVPAGDKVRPTSDRVKEALFNILGSSVIDSEILDLFAGSGALGIEALSRGAKRCFFVERASGAVKVLKDNLGHARMLQKARVIPGDVNKVLPYLGRKGNKFNLIFMDPPYGRDWEFSTLEAIGELCLLEYGGMVVVETRKNKQLPEDVSGLRKARFEIYGDTMLTFYIRGHEGEEIFCE